MKIRNTHSLISNFQNWNYLSKIFERSQILIQSNSNVNPALLFLLSSSRIESSEHLYIRFIFRLDYCWHFRVMLLHKVMTFFFQKSLRSAIPEPEMLITDFAKFDRPEQLHIGFQALHKFVSNKKALPGPWNTVSYGIIYSIYLIVYKKYWNTVSCDCSFDIYGYLGRTRPSPNSFW